MTHWSVDFTLKMRVYESSYDQNSTNSIRIITESTLRFNSANLNLFKKIPKIIASK